MKIDKIPPTPPEPEYQVTLSAAEFRGLAKLLRHCLYSSDVFIRERSRILLSAMIAIEPSVGS